LTTPRNLSSNATPYPTVKKPPKDESGFNRKLSLRGFEEFTDTAEKVRGIAVVVFVDQSEDVVDSAVEAGVPGGLVHQFFM
jgi:hypothetical protein